MDIILKSVLVYEVTRPADTAQQPYTARPQSATYLIGKVLRQLLALAIDISRIVTFANTKLPPEL